MSYCLTEVGASCLRRQNGTVDYVFNEVVGINY